MENIDNLALLKLSLPADYQQTRQLLQTLVQQRLASLSEQFHPDVDIASLLQCYSEFIDCLILRLWSHMELKLCPEINLIAVGGYGRKALFPASDIDLLILSRDELTHDIIEKITQFINLCWDSGLTMSHSVRTLAECAEHAKDDITVMTNLLEARLLSGTPTLFSALEQMISGEKIWSKRDFFQAKLKEQQARHEKYNNTIDNLEPNIKNAPGGLRDIHMICWLGKQLFQANNLSELLDLDFLSLQEYSILTTSQAWLQKVRFLLHCLTHKFEDKLLFDHQAKLAEQFAYQDKAQALAIEQFMQVYYRTARRVNHLNEIILQLFREAIVDPKPQSYCENINKHFCIINNYIAAKDDDLFSREPGAMLEIFLHIAQNEKIQGVRARTIRQLRETRHLIDERFRKQQHHQQLFLALLQQPQRMVAQLSRLHRYGLLGRYVTAMRPVTGKMQYDLFHAYTVDQHTLFVLRNLEQFLTKNSPQFSLCSQIIRQLRKRELIYLAGLFHDIAKGRGGDHSTLGASDAKDFCQLHGLTTKDTELVSWLVQYHLIMSTTAQRRDIQDPDVIATFIETVNTQEKLDYLYVLTVADIRGTNKSLWNGWKDSLLKQLYQASTQALASKPRQQVETIRLRKQLALTTLQNKAFDEHAIYELWHDLGNNYFLHNTSEEITWHSQHMLKHKSKTPLILFDNTITDDESTSLFIYSPDQDYLFAQVCAILGQAGISILEAKIITSKNGFSLDSFQVLNRHNQALTLVHEIEQLKDRLKRQLQTNKAPSLKHYRAKHRHHFPQRTTINFMHDEKQKRTIIELFCLDQPGLLARVGIAFVESGLRIQTAKIVTLGERVEDVFYVTDSNNQAFNDEKKQAILRQRMVELLLK